jgi:hypothetical protein
MFSALPDGITARVGVMAERSKLAKAPGARYMAKCCYVVYDQPEKKRIEKEDRNQQQGMRKVFRINIGQRS